MENKTKKYKNISGQNYIISEIKNKFISADPDKIIVLTDDDVAKSSMLSGLVQNGMILECDEEGFSSVSLPPMESIKKNSSNRGSEIGDDIYSFGDLETDSKEHQDRYETKNNKYASSVEAWWTGPANDMGGYGKMNRECVLGLHRRGAKIQLDMFKIPDFRSSVSITESMNEMMKNQVREDVPSVWAIMPPKFLPRAGYKILFTMMESNGVCQSFIDKCNNADELWLPSRWNMQIFEDAKVKPILKHMPLGVNTDLYKPKKLTEREKGVFKIQTKSFTFVSLFGWSLRKGVDLMLRSYLEEFTRDDDVSLVIASRYFGNANQDSIAKIRGDIKKYIQRYCRTPDRPPHIVHVGQSIPEEYIPILFNMSHCFVLTSRGEGFGLPYCFLPQTLVSLDNGTYKNIEDVTGGDKVLSGDGKTCNVITDIKRKYTGNVIKIKSQSGFWLECTPEHPIAVVKRKTKNDINKDLRKRIEYAESKSISVGDFLVSPVRKIGREVYDTMCLVDIGIETSKFSNKGIKSNSSWKKISDEIGEHSMMIKRTVLDLDHISLKNRNRIKDKLNEIGYIYDKEILEVPKHLEITEDLMRFFGLYIAEGSTSNNSVSFASHSSEREIQEFENKIIRNKFWRESNFNYRGNKCEVSFTLPNAENLFHLFGNNAKNKIIPDFIIKYKPNLLLPLVRGIFEGDGCIYKNSVSFSTSSRILCMQIRDILISNKIRCSVNDCGKNRLDQYQIHIYTDANIFLEKIGLSERVERPERNQTFSWFVDDVLFSIVGDIKEISDYSGYVYNLDTDGESTYVANGFSNHNCEAGACEIPVIATRCGGQMDFLNDDNSYLVDIEGWATNKEITEISSYYGGMPFASLGDKTNRQLKETMRHVMDNYSEAKERAKILRKDLVDGFTWDHLVDKCYDRLESVQ